MKIIKTFLIVTNLAALILQFGLSIAKSTHGPQIGKAKSELTYLSSENQRLKNEIAIEKNMENIQKRSADLGLVKLKTTGLEPALMAIRQP